MSRTVKLRIRQWNGRPAVKEHVLWLKRRGNNEPHRIFKGDEVQELTISTPQEERMLRRATHGGGLEIVTDEQLKLERRMRRQAAKRDAPPKPKSEPEPELDLQPVLTEQEQAAPDA